MENQPGSWFEFSTDNVEEAADVYTAEGLPCLDSEPDVSGLLRDESAYYYYWCRYPLASRAQSMIYRCPMMQIISIWGEYALIILDNLISFALVADNICLQ